MLSIIGFIVAIIGAIITLVISLMGSYIWLRCIFGPIALLLSILGLKEAQNGQKGKKLAITGIVVSGIQCLYIIYIIIGLYLFMN